MSKRGHKGDELTRKRFLRYLRSALNHLYDPDELIHSPLILLFGLAGRPDAGSAVRSLITEAIESLKPPASVSPRSHAARIYDVLVYRYLQQFSQQEVADQLGLSLRHLRREQSAAIEALAYQLCELHHLSLDAMEEGGSAAQEPVAPTATATINHELAWLKETPLEEPTSLEQVLSSVLALAHPLSTQYQAHLDTALPQDLPGLSIHPVALRQILLNLLTVAIHQGSGGHVYISARSSQWEVELRVSWSRPAADLASLSRVDLNSLNIAQRLVELSGCRLALTEEENTLTATLTIPAFQQFPVLVIDDNADMLQLLQRYTSGTRYRLFGTQDPEQVFKLAERVSPQIIVLDVMMPKVDGWELLGRLRHHPLTSHVPVVVCTILAQEELALALGASAFVQKPVTQQAFLSVLDHQVAQMERGSGL
jgi:CheY-like chemotaxis protein